VEPPPENHPLSPVQIRQQRCSCIKARGQLLRMTVNHRTERVIHRTPEWEG
jgi:hypothetical protein